MADKSNDPAAIWQNMIGEMEKGFNCFSNQAMASPEFSKVMNQAGGGARAGRNQRSLRLGRHLASLDRRRPRPSAAMGWALPDTWDPQKTVDESPHRRQ